MKIILSVVVACIHQDLLSAFQSFHYLSNSCTANIPDSVLSKPKESLCLDPSETSPFFLSKDRVISLTLALTWTLICQVRNSQVKSQSFSEFFQYKYKSCDNIADRAFSLKDFIIGCRAYPSYSKAFFHYKTSEKWVNLGHLFPWDLLSSPSVGRRKWTLFT